MFSIRTEGRPIMVYAEWGVFTLLIAGLIVLWWILQFGFSWKTDTSGGFTIPEQVLNSLMAGTTTPQPVPAIVVRNLSSAVSAEIQGRATAHAQGKDGVPSSLSSTASSVPTEPPKEAINYLTAQ